MRLSKVYIKNFMSIIGATVNLDNRGLVSVEGMTKDKDGANSNGSGKSTLLNAILWCNFGDPGKKLDSVDDVVNSKAGKNCMVQCNWYDPVADIDYQIVRYRKHVTGKNGLYVYARDKDFAPFKDISKGTDAETQKLIQTILGCDKQTFEAACFSRQENAPDIPGMTDKALKELLENVLPLEQLSPIYKTAKENRDEQAKLVGGLEYDRDKITYNAENLEKLIAENQIKADSWEDDQAKKKSSMEAEILDANLKISEITGKLKPQASIDAAKAKWEIKIKAFDEAGYKAFYGKFGSCEHDFQKLKSLIYNTPHDCPTCKRPMEKDATREESMMLDLAKHEQALKEFRAEEIRWKEDKQELEEFRLKIKKLNDLERTQDGMRATIEARRADIKRCQDYLGATHSNGWKDALEGLKTKLSDAKAELDRLEVRIDHEKRVLGIKEAACEVYSPKGARYHLLEGVTPVLNEKTNYYLKQLTDGKMTAIWSTVTKLKSGEYKEKFSIQVQGTDFKGYGSLSGGEKRKVRLACFFALQDVIAKQATKSISLWCGDEIDQALDPAGLERLMGLLHEKTATKSTILVISHNELREWIPNFTTVVKEDGISTITGYLNDL